jgi:hypothetical protein
MSTVVVELYEALRKAGVDEAVARSAASAVVPANALGDLATKGDLLAMRTDLRSEIKSETMALRVEISEMKADLIKWNVGTMVALTALCVAIMRLG